MTGRRRRVFVSLRLKLLAAFAGAFTIVFAFIAIWVFQFTTQTTEQGLIEDAKFKCFGCGSAIASSSLATEWLKGKSVDEALTIKNTQIVEELSLPPVKIHCSVLAEDSIRAAIADYRKKNGVVAETTAAAH